LLSQENEKLKQLLSSKGSSQILPKLATPTSPSFAKADLNLTKENDSLRKELTLEKGRLNSLQKGENILRKLLI
jgi:hypothetical protein